MISVYIKEKQKMSKGDSNSKVENEKQPKLAKDKHQSLKKENNFRSTAHHILDDKSKMGQKKVHITRFALSQILVHIDGISPLPIFV